MSPNYTADKKEVEDFLSEFCQLSSQKRPYTNNRQKNQQILIDLGLTLNDQWKIIRSLSAENYVSGPEPDIDRPGFVWKFGITINGTELYIKLKIAEYTIAGTTNLVRIAKCLSFHRSISALTYPLKQS